MVIDMCFTFIVADITCHMDAYHLT